MSIPTELHSVVQTAQVGLLHAAAQQFAAAHPAEAPGMANLFAEGAAAVLIVMIVGPDTTQTRAQMISPDGLVTAVDVFEHTAATIYSEDILRAQASRN